jgi:tetratricopeptide (TPR) repeat protein
MIKPLSLFFANLSLRFSGLDQSKAYGHPTGLHMAVVTSRLAVDCMSDKDSKSLASLLNNHGHIMLKRFQRFDQLADVEGALSALRRTVELLPDGHPHKAGCLTRLATCLEIRFQALDNIADITDAISARRRSIELAANDDIDQPTRLFALGQALVIRFRRLHDPADIDESINVKRIATAAMPDDHPDKPKCLVDLGAYIGNRFLTSSEVADIEDAVSAQRRAVELSLNDSSVKMERLDLLGHLLELQVMHSKSTETDELINIRRRIVEQMPDDNPQKVGLLKSLACHLEVRFRRLDSLADIEEAITAQRRAVDLTLDDHSNKPVYLNSLGSFLETRFKRFGALKDIEEAIKLKRRAIELMPETHPDKSYIFNGLGNCLEARYGRLRELTDITEAITAFRFASEKFPDHRDKPLFLNNLGVSLLSRFLQLGELPDIDEAITSLRRAVELLPDDYPQSSVNPSIPGKSAFFSNLGASLGARFGQLGVLADLDGAITAQRHAVELMLDSHPEKPTYLNNLGVTLDTRFERFGEVEIIDEAIGVKSCAVSLMPDDHPMKPHFLTTLGKSFEARFHHLSELSDLEHAISVHRRANALLPDGHPDQPAVLNNLGVSLKTRFERLGERIDIDDAAAALRLSVTLTPGGHFGEANRVKNLGDCLQRRFERLGETNDIDEAITAHRRVVQRTPDGYADRARRYMSLGISLLARYESFKNMPDLDDALSVFHRAADLTPEGHYMRCTVLHTLGLAWRAWLETSLNPQHFQSAYHYIEEAIRSTGSPEQKLHAALDTVRLCSDFPVYVTSDDMVLRAHGSVLETIPPFIWLGQSIPHRFSQLVEYKLGDAIVAAASAAIAFHKPSLALEWLEEGRNIVWGQLARLRSPIAELRDYDSKLAHQLERTSAALQNAGSESMESPPGMSIEDTAHHHHKLASEYDQILAQVRQLEGFENFFRPKSITELAPAARHGPVALIIVHHSRCDALVLCHPGNVIHIPLPNFSLKMAHRMRLSLSKSIEGGRSAGLRDNASSRGVHLVGLQQGMRRILKLLWLCVVQPIICSIKPEVRIEIIILRMPCLSLNQQLVFSTSIPTDRLPHITWCATGPAAFLPLHAAGIYGPIQDRAHSPRTSDFVVSSFTPSLSALIAPRTQHTQMRSLRPDFIPSPKLLVVSQPDTPEINAPLPGTVVEAAAISRQFPGDAKHLNHERATVDAVFDAMKSHEWVHLACHGIQASHGEPTKSAFLLYDGKLELSRLMNTSLATEAELAVLSACQTAKGDENLPEEAVHLAAGMLAVGYRSVVATMWSINDNDGPILAGAFYAALKKNQERRASGAGLRVAYALHEAVQHLREEVGDDNFARWVPFVHFGL